VIKQSKSYFGVCCARCGKLIVVPAESIGPQNEIAERELNETDHHSFIATCKRCGFEGAYTVRPFQKFDVESCEG
jgi:hypothetical protein